jgi:hypothetical protein
VDLVPLAISGGWAAGVNAYGTVLLLGIFGRLGLGDVPDPLTSSGVIAAAAVMYAIEFVADKVPYLDSVWDLGHTIVRPAIGSAIGAAFGADSSGLEEALAAAGSGTTALASHGVKALLRLGVNVSPEPASNIAVSLTEDGLVAGVVALIVTHPVIALIIVSLLLAAGIALVLAIRRRIAQALARPRRPWLSRRRAN